MSIPVGKYFALHEFACKSGAPYPFTQRDEETDDGRTWGDTRLHPLVETLDAVHEEAEAAVRASAAPDAEITASDIAMDVDSGYRTLDYDARLYDAHLAALRAAGLPDDHRVAPPQSSEHPRGRAGDCKHRRLTPVQLFNLALKMFEEGRLPHLGGIGLYPNFVHFDVRPRPGADGTPTGGHLAIWGGSRPSNVA